MTSLPQSKHFISSSGAVSMKFSFHTSKTVKPYKNFKPKSCMSNTTTTISKNRT